MRSIAKYLLLLLICLASLSTHAMAAEYLVVVNVADGGDWHMRLVNKALYSTYRDCEDLGVGEEARLLMAQQAPERS